MTENTTPERAALMRREAAGIFRRADFDPPGQWPEYFSPDELAALMAGGWRNEHRAEYLKWQRRINGAIAEGMEAERHEISRTTQAKTIDTLGRITFGGLPARFVATQPGKTTTTIHFRIRRQPFAAWLHAAGLDPSEHVRAWLGPELEEKPIRRLRKANTGKTERRDRLSVAIEAALSVLRNKLTTEPTAGDVFDYLAERDENGTIEDSTDEKLTWRTSSGKLKDTRRKSIANRLSRMKAKTPG